MDEEALVPWVEGETEQTPLTSGEDVLAHVDERFVAEDVALIGHTHPPALLEDDETVLAGRCGEERGVVQPRDHLLQGEGEALRERSGG